MSVEDIYKIINLKQEGKLTVNNNKMNTLEQLKIVTHVQNSRLYKQCYHR